MASNFKWVRSPTQGWSVGKLMAYIRGTCFLVLVSWEPIIENEMKGDAPWTDRSANARQNLEAEAYRKSETSVALIARGLMDYQHFLELKKRGQSILSPELEQAGKYAVILPVLEGHYQDIADDLMEAFSGNSTGRI